MVLAEFRQAVDTLGCLRHRRLIYTVHTHCVLTPRQTNHQSPLLVGNLYSDRTTFLNFYEFFSIRQIDEGEDVRELLIIAGWMFENKAGKDWMSQSHHQLNQPSHLLCRTQDVLLPLCLKHKMAPILTPIGTNESELGENVVLVKTDNSAPKSKEIQISVFLDK